MKVRKVPVKTGANIIPNFLYYVVYLMKNDKITERKVKSLTDKVIE